MRESAEYALLQRHGLRPTRQRIAVYRALLQCGYHPTAEELHRTVNSEGAFWHAAPDRLGSAHKRRGREANGSASRKPGASKRSGGPISLATVYNTLQAFSGAGLCRAIPTTGGCRWDPGMHDHVHVRIAETNEVMDLADELGRKVLAQISPALLGEIGRATGLHIDGLAIELQARRVEMPA